MHPLATMSNNSLTVPYGAAEYPSPFAFTSTPVPGAPYSAPGIGSIADPGVFRPTPNNASWISEIPVMGNAPAANLPTNKYLEAGNLIFALNSELQTNKHVRRGAIFFYNLACLNAWLRTQSLAAQQAVAEDSRRFNPLLFEHPEAAWDLQEYREAPATARMRELRSFLTASGVARLVSYVGVNMTQPNMVTSAYIGDGSMSARDEQTQVAWVSRGPARITNNVWGHAATPGKHLWLQLRLTDVDSPRIGPFAQAGAFQFVPYMNDDMSSSIAPAMRHYTGLTGYSELCTNIYVGQMLLNGTQAMRDDTIRKRAAGIALGDRDLADAHMACQLLEQIEIAVHPQRHGSFVAFT